MSKYTIIKTGTWQVWMVNYDDTLKSLGWDPLTRTTKTKIFKKNQLVEEINYACFSWVIILKFHSIDILLSNVCCSQSEK
jgi:hypothetical protein